VFKPKGQWHIFWNSADTPCEIIEKSFHLPGLNYFREIGSIWGDLKRSEEVNKKYSLDMDFEAYPVFASASASLFPPDR
jgi:hypothetical protein